LSGDDKEMKKNSHVIRVEGLISGYGKKEILHGIDIEVTRANITALIGRNGVGKTTLLESIMGFIRPKGGRILLEGSEISGIKPHLIAKMGVSYVPQGKSIFPHMTLEEHIDIGGWCMRNNKEKRATMEKVYSLFPILEKRRSQKAGTLSGGERQMLSIARSMMSHPRLMILDEPSFGLSPKMVDNVFQRINKVREEGVTIFLVEQNAKKALTNSDMGYVMDMGEITFKDKSEKLLQDEEVKRSYLGGKKQN
jgi:branched-chain amino acid transport system ATP-binding protein